MKKRVLILFADPDYAVSEREWEPEYFKKELSDESADVHVALYNDIFFYLDSLGNQKLFVRNNEFGLDDSLAFVWFRTRGERSDMIYDMLPFMNGLAYLLKKQKINFYDEELGDMLSINKFSDKIILSAENFLIPKTFLLTNSANIDRNIILNELTFPVVAKEKAYGSRGDGVSLLRDKNDFDSFFFDEKRFFILQEFIPNNVEYRYVVSDYSLKRVEQRWHNESEEFRNNSCLGAREETLDLNEAEPFIKKEAERAAKLFKRNLCGLDIIKYNDKYYFLEINHTPGFDNPLTVDKSYYSEVNLFSVNVVISDIKKHIKN